MNHHPTPTSSLARTGNESQVPREEELAHHQPGQRREGEAPPPNPFNQLIPPQVWIQEQKAKEEAKRTAELQKQITEERQIQELRQLQAANGQAVKTVDTTLDWMYEGPSAQQDQSTEEYLLGKIYKPQESGPSEVKQLSRDPGSLWLNKISSKNDTFTRMHEDPLLVMKRNEKLSRENILSNPVKMARIRHAISDELRVKEEQRRARKEAKRAKKEAKRSASSRERSQSRSPERRRRERSRSRERPTRDLESQDGNDRRHGRDDDEGRRYGLVSRVEGDESRNIGYLGPRPDLISKRAEREAAEAAARSRPRESVRRMSEEEKARRLAEMQQNAAINDEVRMNRHHRQSENRSDNSENKRANPDFLQKMRGDVYSNEISVEARLQQNRHYVQSSSAMERDGFLRR